MGQDHEVERSFGREGRGNGHFSSPTAMIMDNRGRLLVADTGNNRIQVIDKNGIFISLIGVYQEEGGLETS